MANCIELLLWTPGNPRTILCPACIRLSFRHKLVPKIYCPDKRRGFFTCLAANSVGWYTLRKTELVAAGKFKVIFWIGRSDNKKTLHLVADI